MRSNEPFCFQVVWKEVGYVTTVVIVVLVDMGEEVEHPFLWVYLSQLAASHHRVIDGRVIGGAMVSAEEIALASYGYGPHGVLNEVIV